MRDSHLPPHGDPDHASGQTPGEESDDYSPGRLSPIGWATLVAAVVLGGVLGWGWRVLADSLGDARPVGWLPVLGLWFIGAVLVGVARVTRRAVRGRATLDPERMVNRLVLGRACAVAGALLAGGHVGFGLTWLSGSPDLRLERVGVALLAALGALSVTAGGKLLEIACRIPRGHGAP
ncbi:DUF3180 domain-containing protein [Nocardioides yefusunii]|uniref:DUF3180 domain-containing protein n=1 Tax=Nocardioides yefusunii TaxID=2500546 RepID=A0ABW1QZN3_9ACTN|nr:DUF3180 domain-containing protein [Nocardioides yefusunii]